MSTSGIAREPRGAALVITMLVMAVLLLAGTTFMTISSTESRIALNEQVSTQAMSLAEAGLHRALAKLNDPTTYPSYSGETNTSLGNGTFTVTVSTPTPQFCPGSTREVVVTGSVPVRGSSAKAQIAATVDKIGTLFRYGAFATVPNTIVQSSTSAFFVDGNSDRTENELWVAGDGQVDSFDSSYGVYDATTNRTAVGRIGGNGDVRLDANVQVSGSVRAGDAVNKDSTATVSGEQTTGLGAVATSPGDQFPLITPPGTPTGALSRTGSSTIDPGTYYYTSLTLGDSSSLVPSNNSGPVTIYVTGNVTIGDSVTLGSPGTNLRIIMKSDASLQSTASTDMAVFDAKKKFTFYGGLYGRNANIRVGDESKIYGSIIGRTVHLRSKTQLHYDQAMMFSQICGAAKYAIRPGSWREVIP